MKKYIMIFALTLLVFTMSGCDLIQSDTIEKATEELCRENPDSELCNIDSLDDIEESVVLNLFNNMLENIDTMDINEYCEQFISVTNIDLLDNCRTDITLLFPEGIEDFEVLSVVKEGEEYKVELHNIVTDEMTTFTLGIQMENERAVVSKMQYGPIYVLAPPDEAEVIKLIESFILDMENEALTDTQICEMWDGVDEDCDGIEDARRKFKAGASLSKKVNILDPDDDNDGILVGEISFTLDGHVTVLKIAFDFDNTGDELKLMIRHIYSDNDSDVLGDKVIELIDMFILDMKNENLSDDQVCALWDGIDNDCDGLVEARGKFKAGSSLSEKVNILDPDDDGDGILVGEISLTIDGHVTVLKITFDTTGSGVDAKPVVRDIRTYTMFEPSDELLMKLDEFIDDYSNENFSDEEFYMKWFDETKFGTCGIEDETGDKTSCPPETPIRCDTAKENCPIKLVFVLKTITPPEDNSDTQVYHALFEADHNGHVTVLKIAFDIDETDDALKLMVQDIYQKEYDFVDEKEIFDLDEVQEFWNDFIADYLDATITSEKINELYFNGVIESGFMEDRLSDLENGSTIKTISVNYSNSEPDSFFDIELEVTYLGEIYSSNIKIKVNRIDMALYMAFVDPYVIAELTYEEAITVLDAYKKGYDYYSAQSATRCESTVVDFQKEECVVERDTMFENGFSLVDYELEMLDSSYMVSFTFEDEEFNKLVQTKMVYFYENGDSYLLALYDVYLNEIDSNEVDLLLGNFVKDAGDTTVLTTSVCHFISGGSDGEDNDCDGIVNTVRENGYELMIGEKEDLGDNYIVELVFTNAINNYSEFYYFSFYYDEAMVLKASMNLLDTKAFVYTDIYTLFGKINDFTIPTDEVCSSNVHEDSVARCKAIRTFHESNAYFIVVSELSLNEEMNVIVQTVTYDSMGNEIEQNTFIMNYMRDGNGNNPLFISNVPEGNNPLFE